MSKTDLQIQMEKEDEVVEGQEISSIFTLGSWYDNDCLGVRIGNETYRMPASTVLQMVNEFIFKVEKKRVHKWLVEAVYNPEEVI